MIKKKAQKGITLVALVVSIIIMLILSMVSINMLIGENGIIARARESQILTILSDIIFNMESGMVDINTDRILEDRQPLSSNEMLEMLGATGYLGGTSIFNDKGWAGYTTSLLKYRYGFGIQDERLKDLEIMANGDIWYDNYKRGKIKLSSDINTVYSFDTKSKVTVIDGTAEQIGSNMFMLHAKSDREDFLGWMNKYGQIVSEFSDTVILVCESDEEYTALYGYNSYDMLDRYERRDLESRITKSSEGNLLYIWSNCTHLFGNMYVEGVYDSTEQVQVYDIPGFKVIQMYIFISPNSESLYEITKEDFYSDIAEDKGFIRYGYGENEINKYVNSPEKKENTDFNIGLAKFSDNKIYQIIQKNELKDKSFLDFIAFMVRIDGIKQKFKECGFEDINRLYYRSFYVCQNLYLNNVTDLNKLYEYSWHTNKDESYVIKGENVIKYVDL